MKNKNKNKNKGMILTSWLIIITLVGFFLTLVIKLLPIYIADYSIKQGFEAITQDEDRDKKTPEKIKEKFGKYLITNSISVITSDKLVITEGKEKRIIQLDYEVRTPFFGNIDLILSFHYE